MTGVSITRETEGDALTLKVSGDLIMENLGALEAAFAQVGAGHAQVTIDLTDAGTMDTGGAFLVQNLRTRLEEQGLRVAVVGGSSVLDTVGQYPPDRSEPETPDRTFLTWLARLGSATVQAGRDTLSILEFLGLTLHRMTRALLRPSRLRPASLFTQMEEAGLNAVPIIALMGFLIGVVLAFQGAAQLKQFGAEIFVVDLISISVLRELGVLLTAIIIAGRSGSAFTASIGSMKVQEEIDAMRTLGLDPIEVLVVPRTLALLVVLPILAMIANITGLVGGALMTWVDFGVSPGRFFARLQENTDVWHLAVGLIKAPFFAFTIGVISCYQAMQVKGSSQSLGARTTTSVVQSIFAVILLDAIFSIFFSEIGV